MLDEWVLKELHDRRLVYQDEHFVYADGDHGSDYVDLRPAYPDIGFTFLLGLDIFMASVNEDWNLVIGPDFGGNELAEVVGAAAARHRPVKIVRTRKRGKGFVVHPGRHYEPHLKGCRALVLDDTFTTGGSVKKVINLVRRRGGTVVAVAGVVDRGGLTAETFGVEYYDTLVEMPFPTYKASECPLCAQAKSIVLNKGHGKKFRAANPNYPGGYHELQAAA